MTADRNQKLEFFVHLRLPFSSFQFQYDRFEDSNLIAPLIRPHGMYAVHQKRFDMRSQTVSWKHLLQSNCCKLSG